MIPCGGNRLGVTLESYESLPPLIGEGLSEMFRLKKSNDNVGVACEDTICCG